MKVKDLIQKLSKLDPDMDVLFAKSNWTSEISVGAELVNGYSVNHSQKSNPLGTRPPIFIDYEYAHSKCEDGKTYLNFKSKLIKPAIYLRSLEPDFQENYNKYQAKQAIKNQYIKYPQLEIFNDTI